MRGIVSTKACVASTTTVKCGLEYITSNFGHAFEIFLQNELVFLKRSVCDALYKTKKGYINWNNSMWDCYILMSMGVSGVHIKLSAIVQLRADMGCFATQAFAEGKIIGFHYGHLVHKTLLNALNAQSVRRVDLAAVTWKWFDAPSIWLPKQMLCLEEKFHSDWKVSARSVSFWFINDPCSLKWGHFSGESRKEGTLWECKIWQCEYR